MDLKSKIESFLKQAGMYRDQGLLNEARDAYGQACALIQKNERVKNRDTLIRGLQKKMADLSAEIDHLERPPQIQEISADIQNLIKKKFAFADDVNEAALEGAVALAKFGQYQRAIQEFEGLIQRQPVGVEAAKNIIRSYMAYAAVDDAVDCYERWLDGDWFQSEQMAEIRAFFQSALEREGHDRYLADKKATDDPGGASADDDPQIETIDDIEPLIIAREEIDALAGEITDFQDVNSIVIVMTGRDGRKKQVELTVNFQSKTTLSLLISSREKALMDYLEVGKNLTDVLYYSPYALLHGSGRVMAMNQIRVGPRQGDFSVDIEMSG